jgi:hypothetical protein
MPVETLVQIYRHARNQAITLLQDLVQYAQEAASQFMDRDQPGLTCKTFDANCPP